MEILCGLRWEGLSARLGIGDNTRARVIDQFESGRNEAERELIMKLQTVSKILGLAIVGVLLWAPGQAAPPDEGDAAPLVATHYFFWYRWPDQHFNQPGAPGREGHYHHLAQPEKVSYEDPEWHAGEFAAMRSAGIDVALPVYWGAPGAHDRPGLSFSRAGMAPMVAALQQLGERGVRLGMFYDTSTLSNDIRGASPGGVLTDLTSPAGQELFCGTVLEYFEMIPPELWARIDDRPLVVLYVSAFASAWDEQLGAVLAERFEKRFPGERPYLVADASWGEIGQDRTTSWGAALGGPKLYPGVAQIGPGYNDTPVPERNTPVRDREDGNYYRHSWRAALLHQPELVLIETWNEMHEGTDICPTIETGSKYLDLTREWVGRLKQGGDAGPEIPLKHPQPLPR